jgi:hypothetical protein
MLGDCAHSPPVFLTYLLYHPLLLPDKLSLQMTPAVRTHSLSRVSRSTARLIFPAYIVGIYKENPHEGVEPDSTGIQQATPLKFYTHSTGELCFQSPRLNRGSFPKAE